MKGDGYGQDIDDFFPDNTEPYEPDIQVWGFVAMVNILVGLIFAAIILAVVFVISALAVGLWRLLF